MDSENPLWLGPLPLVLLGCLLIYAILGAWLTDATVSPLRTLLPAERIAMQWVATHTLPQSKFLILTGDGLWDDRTLEWFPALAQRTSVTTVQGSEWLPHNQFYHLWDQSDKLAACGDGAEIKPNSLHNASSGLLCIQNWAHQWDVAFNYIYIRKEPTVSSKRNYWQVVEQALRTSPAYKLVYDGSGATIFESRILTEAVSVKSKRLSAMH